ncbi:MAG: HEAT repeat domain-containing protein [Myxococcota bacterium]
MGDGLSKFGPRRQQGRLARAARLLALGLVVLAALPGIAQERNVMLRTLRSGSDFRVRVQAAFALGNTGDASVRPALERALRESNPAVRAAAATALGRLGDRRARRALRRARRDSSASVRMQAQRALERLEENSEAAAPQRGRRVRTGDGVYPAAVTIPRADSIAWPRVRYVVVMGDVADRSNFRGAEPLLSEFRTELRRQLRLVRGVAVFESSSDVDQAARRQIDRRRIPSLRLDGNLLQVERQRRRRELSVRCAINLVLLTEPGRDLRGMLSGAATGSEAPRANRREQEQRLAGQALGAAIRSAMSSAPRALSAAANR